ncbi:hypothetical protein EV672_10854 [Aquabacterium commune]|uniref:Uncharacterized protein n=1 Tax=Aquabacterium commune TaxID=70586 RepID=A0A4R6R606_9BURK|nr:hypothetical protein [Aquabacterium commune]TDP81269.1 hypothetical protein EV672_10854 [Aquabacterium commune]
MGIRYLKKYAALEDIVTVEDAQALFDWLKQQAKPAVNLSKCVHVHAAVLQVLLMVKPQVQGDVPQPWLAQALSAATPQH